MTRARTTPLKSHDVAECPFCGRPFARTRTTRPFATCGAVLCKRAQRRQAGERGRLARKAKRRAATRALTRAEKLAAYLRREPAEIRQARARSHERRAAREASLMAECKAAFDRAFGFGALHVDRSDPTFHLLPRRGAYA